MLDMSSMSAVRVDPSQRVARVAGGAGWVDVDRAAGAFGLATTGGAISTTGVAGLTLGGGVGWLVGHYGMSIDNLLSVELVTADGEKIRASTDEHPDLFWALRGGGGNFGVATAFEFRLHVLPRVLAGMVAYPATKVREILAFYREFTEDAPDELTAYLSTMVDPESGEPIVALAMCWSGEMTEGERVLGQFDRLGEPLVRMIGPMPYADWQSANDPLFPHGRRYYWKGNLLRSLSDPVLDAIAERGWDPALPWISATIECYAGAMNRVDPTATAYPHREARYQLLSIGAWDDPADDARGTAWARELHAAAEPSALNGSFLNFVALDTDDRAARVAAGYGANWERLVAVKRRYDPANLFRANNNVDPFAGGGDGR
jgi:FAD/FMN-containing dehydrogenase